MDLDLKDKVAVVTGPAKGMGAAISLGFAREGAHLALLGRDTDAIKPVACEARELGVRAEIMACDVTDPDAVDAAIAAVLTHFCGRIDILVSVAGGTGPIGKTGLETTSEEFDEIVHLNMRGPFNMIRAVAPTMQKQKSGKIVNVGGTSGMRGRAMRMAYSSSKWGLRGLTKSFALELGTGQHQRKPGRSWYGRWSAISHQGCPASRCTTWNFRSGGRSAPRQRLCPWPHQQGRGHRRRHAVSGLGLRAAKSPALICPLMAVGPPCEDLHA